MEVVRHSVIWPCRLILALLDNPWLLPGLMLVLLLWLVTPPSRDDGP